MGQAPACSPALLARPADPPAQPVMRSFLETQGGHLGILQCTVDSDPPSEMALHKGGALVGSTRESRPAADPRVSVTPSHNTLRVTITGVTLEDEGQYVCSAHNRYGNSSASVDFTAESRSTGGAQAPSFLQEAGRTWLPRAKWRQSGSVAPHFLQTPPVPSFPLCL